ncbi:unnamed protein product, partial [marine sediment metagenome]
TDTDYAQFSHDDTDFNTAFVTTADWNVSGLTGNFWIQDGVGLKISDSTDADFAIFSHDGDDFNTVFTTTTDWNITGITAIQAGTVDADFDAVTGTTFNAVALTDGGAATSYLDETGNYSEPPVGGAFLSANYIWGGAGTPLTNEVTNDQGTLKNTSELRFDDDTLEGTDDFAAIAALLLLGNIIEIANADDISEYNTFRINGAVVDGTTRWDVPVEYIGGTQSVSGNMTDLSNVRVSFHPAE